MIFMKISFSATFEMIILLKPYVFVMLPEISVVYISRH